MKISIAVPNYNYSKFLTVCLESIKDQDYSDFEVLIADGGSVDGSIDIIKNYCEKDTRFKYISDNDNGQSDAIVKAFKFATGDIFCFLNADDHYLCKDVFSSVVSAFKYYSNVDIISYKGYYTDIDGKNIKPINYRYHPLDSIALMRYRTAVLQPATFWTKAVYKAVDFDADFHYLFDAIFFYKAYLLFNWLELEKPIAGYRLHGGNKSLQIIPKRVFEMAKLEEIKWGKNSFRAFYVRCAGYIISLLVKIPVLGKYLCRLVYNIVNSIAFLTFYRLPSI